ncbi:MAG: hypothetical protein OCD02_20320 [Spirochaetaceae bacterium]
MDPFEFVLAIIFIVVGIPVISSAIVTLIHGPKASRKDKKRHGKHGHSEESNKDREMLDEIYYGLSDLGKRIGNLETILDAKDRED